MVFSAVLLKYPYSLMWHLIRLLRRNPPLVFHCAEMMDWHCFAPISRLLPETRIVSSNPTVRSTLRQLGIKVYTPPVCPKAVIMCRHATHKYPCASIVKIGMRHGPYHFKRMTSAANYNQFDLYLFSSNADLEAARKIGVTKGKAIGFPRLDPAINGSISRAELDNLAGSLTIDPSKPILLFTATWDASGMSAISMWHNRLKELTAQYNVMVTVHPWTDKRLVEAIRNTPEVRFLSNLDLLPYIMLADVCIGDQSSLLAECSALNKPIISFRIPTAKRSLPEIENIMDLISMRVSSFEDLLPAIEHLLAHPDELAKSRLQANSIMFDTLDGKSAERAASEINKLLRKRNI